jgi:Tfp pilus assembly pilus retraction ATPase PilT
MEIFHRILQTAIDGGASDVHLKIGGPSYSGSTGNSSRSRRRSPTAEWMDAVVKHVVPKHLHRGWRTSTRSISPTMRRVLDGFGPTFFSSAASLPGHEVCQDAGAELRGIGPAGRAEEDRRIAPGHCVGLGFTTGCGKSTTLAAMIEHINANFKKHIITLEDPIEYVFEDNQSVIEQREVGLDTLSFGMGLKHVLRQDPDIIMIGEMRDATSFSAAMSAADTGHLVLSTLHTTNAAQSVGRILDFFKMDERDHGAAAVGRDAAVRWFASGWSPPSTGGSCRRSRS